MIKVKKIKHIESQEIDTTSYEHYSYIKTTRSNLIYLFGEPTASVFCPEEEDLIEYAKQSGILSYDYWILENVNGGCQFLIDGEDTKSDAQRPFCISSDDEDGIRSLSSSIVKKRWPIADEIRKKIFILEE
jgi:hypothetical protein